MGLWHKLIQSISFSVATPEGRQRLEPLDFALRVAVLVTIIAVVIDTAGLFILSLLGLVTDLANGLMLGTTLSATIAFTLALIIGWINAREVKLLAQSHERFLHLSHTDALTGLNNRLGLYANCARLDTQYCVAFVDIDRFKSVNDRYGHLAGDMVISSVAAMIRDCFDETAYIARLGGEEFVVVQELAPQDFLELCEKARAGSWRHRWISRACGSGPPSLWVWLSGRIGRFSRKSCTMPIWRFTTRNDRGAIASVLPARRSAARPSHRICHCRMEKAAKPGFAAFPVGLRLAQTSSLRESRMQASVMRAETHR